METYQEVQNDTYAFHAKASAPQRKATRLQRIRKPMWDVQIVKDKVV